MDNAGVRGRLRCCIPAGCGTIYVRIANWKSTFAERLLSRQKTETGEVETLFLDPPARIVRTEQALSRERHRRR